MTDDHRPVDYLHSSTELLARARDANEARIADLEPRGVSPELDKLQDRRLRIAEDFLHAGDLEWRHSDSEARLTARQDVLLRFLEEAVHLRLYGEAAPGGRVWDAWEQDAHAYLGEHGTARRREDRS